MISVFWLECLYSWSIYLNPSFQLGKLHVDICMSMSPIHLLCLPLNNVVLSSTPLTKQSHMLTQKDRTAPCPSTPGPNTLTLEVSTAGSTITLAGKPGTALPPYFSSRVYMPEVRGM